MKEDKRNPFKELDCPSSCVSFSINTDIWDEMINLELKKDLGRYVNKTNNLIMLNKAKIAHKMGSKKQKKMLEHIFGKELFYPKPLTERILTMADVCEEIGEPMIDFVEMDSKGFTVQECAFRQIKQIMKCFNGVLFEYENGKSEKFGIDNSIRNFKSFAYTIVPIVDSDRLIWFKSKTDAMHVMRNFSEVFRRYYVG